MEGIGKSVCDLCAAGLTLVFLATASGAASAESSWPANNVGGEGSSSADSHCLISETFCVVTAFLSSPRFSLASSLSFCLFFSDALRQFRH